MAHRRSRGSRRLRTETVTSGRRHKICKHIRKRTDHVATPTDSSKNPGQHQSKYLLPDGRTDPCTGDIFPCKFLHYACPGRLLKRTSEDRNNQPQHTVSEQLSTPRLLVLLYLTCGERGMEPLLNGRPRHDSSRQSAGSYAPARRARNHASWREAALSWHKQHAPVRTRLFFHSFHDISVNCILDSRSFFPSLHRCVYQLTSYRLVRASMSEMRPEERLQFRVFLAKTHIHSSAWAARR